MDSKILAENGEKEVVQKSKKASSSDPGPFIRFRSKRNQETGKNQFAGIELSDGTQVNNSNKEASEEYMAALKRATGTDNENLGQEIYQSIAVGLYDPIGLGLNRLLTLLPGLRPQNENEALLLGQFIALQDSGFRCLRHAMDSQNLQNIDRYYSLSTKLFRTANETIQTLLKYRNGGRQEIQIVHLHNEGQAIIAQNLSNGGGGTEKSTN